MSDHKTFVAYQIDSKNSIGEDDRYEDIVLSRFMGGLWITTEQEGQVYLSITVGNSNEQIDRLIAALQKVKKEGWFE